MIKFFRKIRQKLLSENKFSKYLIYAIGEIILVVIGILIALQVNNLNQEKKSSEQIDLLLNNLVEEVKQDIETLKTSAKLNEFQSNSLAQILKITGTKLEIISRFPSIPKSEEKDVWKGPYPDTLNRRFVNLSLYFSGIYDQQALNRNILEELKNTGLFSAIKSDSLKKAINEYYNFLDRRLIKDDGISNLILSWKEFLRDNYGILTMEKTYKKDPILLIQENEDIQIRMFEIISVRRFQHNFKRQSILFAQDLLKEIEVYKKE
jgi:hypothetical protein